LPTRRSSDLVPHARGRLDGAKEAHEGPLLVTHWGLSGPAVLRASAWHARLLHDHGYRLGFTVDWRPDLSEEEVRAALQRAKEQDARRNVLARSEERRVGKECISRWLQWHTCRW